MAGHLLHNYNLPTGHYVRMKETTYGQFSPTKGWRLMWDVTFISTWNDW